MIQSVLFKKIIEDISMAKALLAVFHFPLSYSFVEPLRFSCMVTGERRAAISPLGCLCSPSFCPGLEAASGTTEDCCPQAQQGSQSPLHLCIPSCLVSFPPSGCGGTGSRHLWAPPRLAGFPCRETSPRAGGQPALPPRPSAVRMTRPRCLLPAQ